MQLISLIIQRQQPIIRQLHPQRQHHPVLVKPLPLKAVIFQVNLIKAAQASIAPPLLPLQIININLGAHFVDIAYAHCRLGQKNCLPQGQHQTVLFRSILLSSHSHTSLSQSRYMPAGRKLYLPLFLRTIYSRA